MLSGYVNVFVDVALADIGLVSLVLDVGLIDLGLISVALDVNLIGLALDFTSGTLRWSEDVNV